MYLEIPRERGLDKIEVEVKAKVEVEVEVEVQLLFCKFSIKIQ